jgi:hypothetical protein
MWVIYGGDKDINSSEELSEWTAPVANFLGTLNPHWANVAHRIRTDFSKIFSGGTPQEIKSAEDSHKLYKWRNRLFHMLVKTFGNP